MVEVYDGLARRAIGIEAFFAQLAEIRAPRFSAEHIARCALHLAELAQREDLIWDHLAACRDAAGWNRALLAPHSFVLASSDHALLRANLWSPIKPGSPLAGHERALHGYDIAHNHDFHLLSVGYFGPGSVTELYRFDPDTADGSCPQPVQLERRGAVRPTGAVSHEGFLWNSARPCAGSRVRSPAMDCEPAATPVIAAVTATSGAPASP